MSDDDWKQRLREFKLIEAMSRVETLAEIRLGFEMIDRALEEMKRRENNIDSPAWSALQSTLRKLRCSLPGERTRLLEQLGVIEEHFDYYGWSDHDEDTSRYWKLVGKPVQEDEDGYAEVPWEHPVKVLQTLGNPQHPTKDTAVAQIVFAPKLYQDITDGLKMVTIRKGIRNYNLGPAEAVHRDTGECQHIVVTSVRYSKFEDIPPEDFKADFGNADLEECLKEMQQYYPDLALDTVMTVVHFK